MARRPGAGGDIEANRSVLTEQYERSILQSCAARPADAHTAASVHSATSRFIERFGLLFERDGFTRIAGRITALLLVADRALSLDELAELLSVSKASASTEARRLVDRGLLVRTSRLGDRRDYYEFAPDGFRPILQARVEALRRLSTLIAEAERLPGLTSQVRRRIDEWSEVHAAMGDALTSLLARWKVDVPASPPTITHR